MSLPKSFNSLEKYQRNYDALKKLHQFENKYNNLKTKSLYLDIKFLRSHIVLTEQNQEVINLPKNKWWLMFSNEYDKKMCSYININLTVYFKIALVKEENFSVLIQDRSDYLTFQST